MEIMGIKIKYYNIAKSNRELQHADRRQFAFFYYNIAKSNRELQRYVSFKYSSFYYNIAKSNRELQLNQIPTIKSF